MLWTYIREGRQTSFEVRQSLDGTGFELRRTDAQGREVIELFDSPEQLNRRIEKVESDLMADGWSLAGAIRR